MQSANSRQPASQSRNAGRHTTAASIGIFIALVALLAGACAGKTIGAGPNGAIAPVGSPASPADDDPSTGTDDSAVTDGDGSDDDALPFDDSAQTGDSAPVDPESAIGGTVKMARADWSSGAMQAEIYAQLLTELGYAVDRGPELPPEEFYKGLATGDFDLWANSWPISHDKFFDAELADGSFAGDHMRYVGSEMLGGGLQGFLIDIPTATAAEILSLDDIANDPNLVTLFDTDGDGRAEIAGCNVGWGCELVIDNLIVDNEWDQVLEQVKGVHGELFAEQVGRFEAGQPVLAYVWTPGPFIAQLQPGRDVYWLGVENPAPDQSDAADLPVDQCRMDPCTMGFSPSDIVVAANNDFLAAQPGATKLLELVKIGVLDVSFQNVKMLNGEDSPEDVARHASEWISDNRSDVDRWLSQAIQAAS